MQPLAGKQLDDLLSELAKTYAIPYELRISLHEAVYVALGWIGIHSKDKVWRR
jgi:predicted small integral membrane protein